MKATLFVILSLILTNFSISSYAQIKPSTIGDKVPDVAISDILNYKVSSAKFSDFKGKLLIIDFWATWCAPCVAMIPKNDSLQKKFNGRVQFLPVSREDRNTVKGFLRKLSSIKYISMTSVVNDTLLTSMFIHHYLPYYVWIDSQGELIATTEATEVNEENIQSILNGKQLKIVNIIGKKFKILDPKMSFFITGHPILNSGKDSTYDIEPVADNQILYQSILSKYVPDLQSNLKWDSTHFTAVNAALINLYRLYFGLNYKKSPLLFWSKSRCKVEVTDSLLADKINTTAVGQKCTDWLEMNGYNYELIWKNAKTWQEKYDLLGEDLDRYFSKPLKISAVLEKRLAPSDILTVEDKSINLKTIGGKPFEKHDAFSYIQQNMPLNQFLNQLQGYFWQASDHTIFDETNFKGNVDLELNCKMVDIDAVNKALAKYGLKFIDGNRMTDILIIKDR